MRGATRVVILIGKLAIKLPRPLSLRTFLTGMPANLQEREFGVMRSRFLAPVLFPGAWLW